MEPSLWAQLVPEPEDLASFSSLLKRFGSNIRYLKIASHGPHRLSTSLKELSRCSQLEELYLGGFRGRDLESFCQTSCRIDSLRALTVESDPYFNLGSFSHNTGAHMASLPAAWLSSFPNLERLVCDYLKLDTMEPLESDSEVSLESLTPRLPTAALRREPSDGAFGPSLAPETRLRELSFVAVVRGHGSTWNAPGCRCDLSVLATLAPQLERLQIRSPNIALGRMSRRPGQRMDGLMKVSRHFCSTGLRDLLAAGHLLPALKELKVEVVKDDTGQPWDSSGSVLSTSQKTSLCQTQTSHLALALGVYDRPFRIFMGASDLLANKLRSTANVPATAASIATFQSFAVAEQHLPLLQLVQRFQETERQKGQSFEIEIVEVA